MLIIILLTSLFACFCAHVYYLIKYLLTHGELFLWRFISLVVANMFLAGGCIFVALYWPETIAHIDMSLLVWVLSGMVMVAMIFVQVAVFRRIYLRSKLPEHYHYNFFGKKVLHATVAKPLEIGIFFASMPMLLIPGAYFIARLIKQIILAD